LTAFATGRARFVGRPLVRRTFFMRRSPTLAGDLTLFFWGHRGEPSAFFAIGIHVHSCTPKW
jgi:hypothetical protein